MKNRDKVGTGDRIRTLRLALGLSQEAFGELLKTSSSSISEYENENVGINHYILCKIIKLTGVSGDFLLATSSDMEEVKKAVYKFKRRRKDMEPITEPFDELL